MQCPCHLCGNHRSRIRFRRQGHTYHQCASCGLLLLHPQPENVQQTYDLDYYEQRSLLELSPLNQWLYERYLRQLDSLLTSSSRRLLDVGCGVGNFLQLAQTQGWQVEGTEISPPAVQHARRQYGLDVYQEELSAFPDGTYDAVTLWDVLEHLPAPLDTLAQAYRLLKPGGILALSTVNVRGLTTRLVGRRSCVSNPEEHLFYFSASTLCQLLQRAGFDLLQCTSQMLLLRNLTLGIPRPRTSPGTRGDYLSLYRRMQSKVALNGIRCANRGLQRLGLGDQLLAFARR